LMVFKSIPSGEPPLARFVKKTCEWRRDEFEGTLRQWYRFMVVKNEVEATEIREEWRKTFDKLPPEDDPNQLAAELKPKWAELPTFVQRRVHIRKDSSVLDGVSTMLENPPVNPFTGPGRTGTEVERETAAYRAYIRREHGNGRHPPVFQGDYLFVQLQGKPIFLARVVHDCFMDDALSADISFTIGEYEHKPQERVTHRHPHACAYALRPTPYALRPTPYAYTSAGTRHWIAWNLHQEIK
jgi:hypothetical protein